MLDRKNPYSAIPQLEKKIDNISTEQTDIGLDYSAFKEQTKHDLIVIDGEIVDANALIVAETNRATGVENELRAIVDNTIETWFYSGVPTLSNPPAYNWTTDVLKDRHVGDLYYDNATGYAYRFIKVGGVYSWSRLSDSAVVEALAVARTKRKIWVGSGTPEWTPDEGDLWCNPSGDTKVWNGTLWIKSSKYTDDTLAQSALDYAGVVATDLSDEVTRAINSENDIDEDVNGITVFTDGTHDVYKDNDTGEYYYLDANERRVIVQESALVTEGGDLKTRIKGGKTDAEETKEIIETLAQKVGVDEFSDNKAFVETYLGSSGYVSLEGSSLTLGRGDFVAKLDERFLGFYRSNSGSPVALIGQNEVGEGIMSIDKGEISSDLSFGKFQWITRSNGNLTLKWRE